MITVLHVLICVSLVSIILMQRGRGGGLVDSFSNLETVFGTRTSAFLTKATTVLAICFILTCLLLAFLSLQASRSLLRNVPVLPAAHNATVQTNATASTPATGPASPVGAVPSAAAASPAQQQAANATQK